MTSLNLIIVFRICTSDYPDFSKLLYVTHVINDFDESLNIYCIVYLARSPPVLSGFISSEDSRVLKRHFLRLRIAKY